jgi:exportin-1
VRTDAECFCLFSMFSEEVFDFSQGKMTAAKTAELKQQFSKEFASIYQLCDMVLKGSLKPSLLSVALDTMLGFLSWIPIGYIFETTMVELLVERVRALPCFPFHSAFHRII